MRNWAIGAAVLTAALGTPPTAAIAENRVPSPESAIGFTPCADFKLATYEQIAAYFRKLDAATDRMQVVDIGPTAEGRRQILALISSEQNLANLSRYKQIARSLALNRDASGRPLTDALARQLARDGKAVMWVDFGLHSTEVAAAQVAPWMAWKAVTEETQEMREIRDKVIFVLVPNLNPDGTTLVADWYMKHVGTPWEMSVPALYQKYAGHDNNRDWFMFTQPESRNIAKQLYEEYFPQVVYNQHQAAPFPARIFVPPFEDPSNFNIPPLVIRGVNTVGDAITRRLDQEGKVGAISRVQFDTWWNGGMRTAPYFHNMVGILTETAHPSPTPATYDPARFPSRFPNGESTLEPSTYYPSPYMGGRWTMRDSCEYMLTASMSVLDIGAKRREEWLYDIYQMARDAMKAGANETYIIPTEQWDPGAAVRMVNVLRVGAVEIERATVSFMAGGKPYTAGSYLIHGAQPYLPYVRDLLNPQAYPDRRLYPDGPPEPPYDISGWTLSMQMGVRVDKVREAVTASTEKVSTASMPPGGVSGTAKVAYAIDPRTNEAFVAVNRLLKAGDVVQRTTGHVDAGGAHWPAGTFLVTPGQGTHARLEQVAKALGLKVASFDTALPAETLHLKPPRVGVYKAWEPNADEGWTRWVLEQYEFSYTSVLDADIRAGSLRAKFDVILLPDARHGQMVNGFASGTMPPDYVGGMGANGVGQLLQFVADGGTLVAQDRATELPLAAMHLPVRNAVAGIRSAEFYIPGTLLRLTVDTTNPVAWGMPQEVAAFFTHSPVFEVSRRERDAQKPDPQRPDAEAGPAVNIVASYPGSDVLMSGWLLGERYLHRRAAVLEARVNKGRVVLLGFRAQHRAQPHATFKLLFNSIYLSSSEAGVRLQASRGPDRRSLGGGG
jgi:hypothetical protein